MSDPKANYLQPNLCRQCGQAAAICVCDDPTRNLRAAVGDICTDCGRPKATDHHWSREYSKAHGDGNGCECAECVAVCWGGPCRMWSDPADRGNELARLRSRLAAAEAVCEAAIVIEAWESPVSVGGWCVYCQARLWQGEPHRDTCKWPRVEAAKTALSAWRAAKDEGTR